MPPRLKEVLKKERAVRGADLRRLRRAQGWTQSDCACQIDTTYQTWQRYEAGTSWPSRDREILICDILSVPRLHFVETKTANRGLAHRALSERTIDDKLKEVLQVNLDDYDQPSEMVKVQTRLMRRLNVGLSKARRDLGIRDERSSGADVPPANGMVKIRKMGNI